MKLSLAAVLLLASQADADKKDKDNKQIDAIPDLVDQQQITLQTLEKEKKALEQKLAQAQAQSQMPAAASTTNNCYTGTLKSGFSTMTVDDVMEALWPQVQAAVQDYTKRHEWYEDLFERSGTCQMKCFEDVTSLTYKALYGKLGPDYVSEDNQIQRIFIQATAGAFTACYPSSSSKGSAGKAAKSNNLLDRELDLAEAIVKVTQAPGAPAYVNPKYKFPEGLACMNEGKEDQFPIAEFMMGFENELNMLMSEDVYFAKSCQKTCLKSAVETAVLTLFRTNSGEDSVLERAISGAVHACVPEVGQDSVNTLIANAKVQLVSAQKKAASGSQSCYGGAIEINKEMVPKDKFMKGVMAKMNGAIIAVTNDDADLKSYMSNNGTCQADCLKDMMPPTLNTLYGKLGVHFADSGEMIGKIFDASLGAAFKACYPCASDASMKKVAAAIVKSFKTAPASSDDADLPSSGDCTHSDFKDMFDANSFKSNFSTTLKLMIAEDLEMADYLKLKAKACQVPCLDETVPLAVGTLMKTTWTDRSNWKDLYSTAVSSAVRACFPEIPQKMIDALTKEVMKTVLPPAEEPKKEKKKCKKKPSGNSTGNSSGGNSSDSGSDDCDAGGDSNSSSGNSTDAAASAPAAAAPPPRLYSASNIKTVSWINNLTFVGLFVGACLTLASVVAMFQRRSSSGMTYRDLQTYSNTRVIEATELDTVECDEEGLMRTTNL